MKKLLSLAFLLFSLLANAQNRSKTFGITYGIGNGDITDYSTKKMEGNMRSDEGKSTQIFGLNYFDEVGRNLFIETGLSILKHDYTFTTWTRSLSGFATTSSEHSLKSLSIPLKLRFEFGKYFFLNGGLITDIGLTKTQEDLNDISGMGLGLGLGIQYYHNNKIGVFLNPQINAHGLLGFGNTTGIFERNITFGLAYRIN